MRYCYPPDPNTKKPHFTPPAGACDTHFHVFGPPEEFPFVATHEYTPPAAPLEHYQKMATIIGIERAVVVQPSVHGLDNLLVPFGTLLFLDRYLELTWIVGERDGAWATDSGPWSALDFIDRADDVLVTTGPHRNCAEPPAAVPATQT